MKMILYTTILLAVSILFMIILSGCTRMGTKPSKIEIDKFQNSENYNTEKKQFQNRRPKLVEEMRKRLMTWGEVWNFMFGDKPENTVPEKLPEVKPDIAEFLKESDDLKVIWFGHSSFMLNISGKIILVDPVFSDAASPVSFMVKRFQKPVIKPEELPEIDYILISHDHYDHLDMETIKFFKDKNITFITPLGVGSYLKGWEVSSEKIIEKDWWQEENFEGIKFIATPAQHFSGRSFSSNVTLWASWIIETDEHKIYYSGDSGYDTHFKEIGNKYGPFDVAFIESGQYNMKWQEVHMLPEESVKAFEDLKADKYFPVHWGMFELAPHSWYEPVEKLYNFSIEKKFELYSPKIGELVNLNKPYNIVKWWDETSEIPAEAYIVE